MALSTLDSPWRKQPQEKVELSGPFKAWEWVFTGWGRDRNFGTRGAATGFTGATPDRLPASIGIGASYPAGDSITLQLGVRVDLSVISGVIVFERRTNGVNQALYANSTAPAAFYVKINNSNRLELDARSTELIVESTGVTVSADTLNVAAFCKNGSAISICLNGNFFSVTNARSYDATGTASFPGEGAFPEYAAHSQFLSAVTAGVALTQEQMIALTRDVHAPWELMFEPQRTYVPFSVAAGSFLSAWARNSNQLIGAGSHVS